MVILQEVVMWLSSTSGWENLKEFVSSVLCCPHVLPPDLKCHIAITYTNLCSCTMYADPRRQSVVERRKRKYGPFHLMLVLIYFHFGG